ncbi:transposase, partial [endosymbiont of unidentified scaly snail isolate Monju]|uniref:transposase n=1 Tax=endosymbiont of unidentified scaly snail isolate Monju TaxID=1248727 RepID=UPI000389249B
MPRVKGLGKVHQYSNEFKVTAARLSHLPEVRGKDLAAELDIHPFMLSRGRKEYREGKLEGDVKKPIDPQTAAELKRLRKLERDYAWLKEEHEILKKAI